MSKDVIQVQIKALIPTNAGVAVFLGNEEKIFVIYVDPSVGSAINMFVNGTAKERPLTHDLMALILAAVGARVERVIVNDLKSGTYFGRLIITAENELQQRKIIELDSRPSDCLAMATHQKAPIFVSREVWDEVEDMSDVLETMQHQSGKNPDEEEDEET
ncbi:MAG: bifunctional nuclease family protein [Terrimicrobiaceae bacterium]